jgi:cysteinyl-tRNA synthetase
VQKWALADRIRDDLAGHGVLLRDSRETTEWDVDPRRSPDETARAVVNGLAAMRREARSRQDWALADALRDALADAGVVLRDTRSGTEWAWAEGAPAQERAHEEETA